MRALALPLVVAMVVAPAFGQPQVGMGLGSNELPPQLRASGCPDGYWLQTQAVSSASLPANMLPQPGRRLVARCVGLVVEAPPACPAGLDVDLVRGPDGCTAKGGAAAILKPRAPTCAAPAKLSVDAGPDGRDLCVAERIELPVKPVTLGLPWGFSL
jgi:hypothetical protein